MKFLIPICFAQFACTTTALEETSSPLTSPGSCSTTAIPDDGLDDSLAIKTALETQGCAILPSGTFDIDAPSPRPSGVYRYDMIRLAGGRMLSGAGPSTVIRFRGDAGDFDFHGIGMTGDDNLVSNLVLDTTGLTNTSEQTHAIQMTGPARGQVVTAVWFRHPSLGPGAGGDCIKVVGYDPDQQVSLAVSNNVFSQCDRSGIAIHSGVTDAVIANNLFLATGDSDIDLEGTGGAIDNLSVTGNVFRRSLNGSVSVSIGAGLTRRAVISGNTLGGGRLYAYNVEYLTVTGNAFQVPTTAIEMVKMSKEVVISGNTFLQTDDAATSGGAISCNHHESGKPGSISISGNTFRSSNQVGTFLNLLSAEDVAIRSNTFVWTPTSVPSGRPLAVVYGIVQPTEAILFSDNLVRGGYARVLQVTNSYEASNGGGIRAVTFAGNVLRGPTAALYCPSPGPGPYVSYGNSGAPHSCSATMTAGN